MNRRRRRIAKAVRRKGGVRLTTRQKAEARNGG